MDITTKYNLNDELYFCNEGEIIRLIVSRIIVENSGRFITISYENGTGFSELEADVFLTGPEALDDYYKKVDEWAKTKKHQAMIRNGLA